jgi:hypothetical protein
MSSSTLTIPGGYPQPVAAASPLTHTTRKSTKGVWTGRIISALPVLFLVFDSVIKLVVIDPVVSSFAQLGWPVSVAIGIGTLEIVCLAAYLIPRTSIFGAVLLTGFLGGAVATHLRIGDPLLSHTLFPVYVGTLLWLGLYLRDGRVRALLAARR